MIAIEQAAEAVVTPEATDLGILAVLQGLTEFLPVSSSGHLVLSQAALGLTGPVLRLDVALHLGTLGAVLMGYRKDLIALVREVLGGKFAEVGLLAIGTLPAVVIGLGMRDLVHEAFESVRAAAFGLCGTAAILVVGEVARRRALRQAAPTQEAVDPGAGRERIGVRDALVIGMAQALAILPGISRSGSTIATGLVCGLRPSAAARFSFLLAIPTIAGAAILELPDTFAADAPDDGVGTWLLAGAMVLAGAVGYAALRGLLAFLGRGAFAWFAAYCALLGIGVLVFTS